MRTTECKRAISAVVLVLLVLGTGAQGSSAPQAPLTWGTGSAGAVRILPFPAHVEPGGTVTVDLWLENGSNYYGIDVRLHFDTARLRATAAEVTPLWEVFDEGNHFTIKNRVDNTTGEVWYAVTNTNLAEPFTGTGRICSITFTGLEPGAGVLDLY